MLGPVLTSNITTEVSYITLTTNVLWINNCGRTITYAFDQLPLEFYMMLDVLVLGGSNVLR